MLCNKLYIITAVHNRKEITKRFIDILKQQTLKSIYLILVDDGSTDYTAEMVKNEFKNSIILKGNGNLWWAGSLHLAYKWVIENLNDEDIVVITNDDNYFENDFFSTMVSKIQENSKSIIVGCGYNIRTNKQEDGVLLYNFSKGGTVTKFVPETTGNYTSSRCIGFRVKDFKVIGGFHPILLPHYRSDSEWILRASKKKYKIQSFADLRYQFDGYESSDTIEKMKGLSLKLIFSKKTNLNPIYKTTFFLLVTPFYLIPLVFLNKIMRVLKR